MSFGRKAEAFYKHLKFSFRLPKGIAVMNPYQDKKVQGYTHQFCRKFYDDLRPRVLVFGINPGRYGAGITGITFTDPVALQEFCGIPNDLPKVRELSSVFIYQFIEHYGGPKKFYDKFFLTAASPLGYLSGGKNYNYYDDAALMKAVEPFILDSIMKQIKLGATREVAVILGRGKNQKFFAYLNNIHGFFKKLLILDHPRFIMQYKRRFISRYIKEYYKIFHLAGRV